jgi:hypothetical protein
MHLYTFKHLREPELSNNSAVHLHNFQSSCWRESLLLNLVAIYPARRWMERPLASSEGCACSRRDLTSSLPAPVPRQHREQALFGQLKNPKEGLWSHYHTLFEMADCPGQSSFNDKSCRRLGESEMLLHLRFVRRRFHVSSEG